MRCRAAFTCCANGCFSVFLSVPVLAVAADPAAVLFSASGRSPESATCGSVTHGDPDGDRDHGVFATASGADSGRLKATGTSLFADGFEVGDPSMWTRSEPNGVNVSGVAPDNGVAGGGDTLTITGSRFTGTIDVQIDGVSCISWLVIDDGHISCQTPPHAPAVVRLTVWRNGGHGTIAEGFRFTGEDDLLVVDWAALKWPDSVACSAGAPMETIIGLAHSPGLTDPVGPPGPSVVAEVGWGPPATHPGRDPGWLWVDVPWFADWEPDSDEFRVAPTCPPPGIWALAFRCSADGGLTYLYGDFYPGTADGFDVSDLVALVSQ